ncbi:hypothetical protein Vretimale_5357 [Volvox reticuliferus]|uniref:Uncharacterized protein n=1 Tax=Volvox reticuliferus TaxID=1737510 RepID=A0A8J4DFB1_9CHLO|nr:hypothetical protein Vretifemale_3888 [Volvox reticuliferus]GIM00195.1 hypothetical protein Vretimale_5357 [Volvox reticuliferus]
MAHACRAPAHRAFACRSSHGRNVVVRAQTDTPKVPAIVSLMTTTALVLTAVPALSPPELMLLQSARADDTSEELLTPYQRRQRELERRRELLRQAREQAEGRAGGEVAGPSTAEADAAVEAANAERRAAASKLSSELKNSAATYESSTAESTYRGFGGFNAAPAPEPRPAPEPAPTPAPASAPKAAKQAATPVVKEEPKVPQQPQKRRGPLPLFLAELLVLGSFAGGALAVTKYSEQTSKALALAGAKGKELYASAEGALAKAQQPK